VEAVGDCESGEFTHHSVLLMGSKCEDATIN
jgi:hypothetical protein